MVFDNYKFRSPVSLHNPVQEKHPIKNPRMYLEDLEENIPNSAYYGRELSDDLTKGVKSGLLAAGGKFVANNSKGSLLSGLGYGAMGIGALGMGYNAIQAAHDYKKSRQWAEKELAAKTAADESVASKIPDYALGAGALGGLGYGAYQLGIAAPERMHRYGVLARNVSRKRGAIGLGAAGALYGAKKLYDRRQAKTAALKEAGFVDTGAKFLANTKKSIISNAKNVGNTTYSFGKRNLTNAKNWAMANPKKTVAAGAAAAYFTPGPKSQNKTASMNTYNKLEAFLEKTAAYKKNKYASIARTATNVGKNIGKTLGETLRSSKGQVAAGALGGAGLMSMHNQYHNN